MKKFSLFFMCGIFVTAFVMTGCKDETIGNPGSFIELNASTLDFDVTGGSEAVTVSTDGDWIVTGGADWVTVSTESGERNATVTITVAQNEFFTQRGSVLTFRTGTQTAAITVLQETRILQDTIIGVVINDVRWATRNVIGHATNFTIRGTFVASPELPGSFYQWNRRRGFPAANPATGGIGWVNDAGSSSNAWVTATDPCPAGWRVPTIDEMESLLNDTRVLWTTYNGVNGRVFTDENTGNAIFLPAGGWRNRISGTLSNVGAYGLYWSTPVPVDDDDDDAKPEHLFFTSEGAAMFESDVRDGFKVRCVAE